MGAQSKGGRSYSDQSYGVVQTQTIGGNLTAGTRATAIVNSMKLMNTITVLDWNAVNCTLGTGGSSQWVLAATSSNGTTALGTIIFVGTHAAGASVDGAVTGTSAVIAADGVLNLYSVLSTAADLNVTFNVAYRESFVSSDN